MRKLLCVCSMFCMLTGVNTSITVGQQPEYVDSKTHFTARRAATALRAAIEAGKISSLQELADSPPLIQMYGASLSHTDLALLAALHAKFASELGNDRTTEQRSLVACLEYLAMLNEDHNRLPAILTDEDVVSKEVEYQVMVPTIEKIAPAKDATSKSSGSKPRTIEQTYQIKVPYSEMVTQNYTVSIPIGNGKTRQENRTRQVRIVKFRSETRTKTVTVGSGGSKSSRTVMKPETRTRKVSVAKKGNEKLEAFVEEARSKLCLVSFASAPTKSKVAFLRKPSASWSKFGQPTPSASYFRPGDYRFAISKPGAPVQIVDVTLDSPNETVEQGNEDEK